MLFYKVVFGTCLLLLCVSYVALARAYKQKNSDQARVLHLFRLGLSLSALSYFLRLTNSPHSELTSPLMFVTCLTGTFFLWRGWMEHWKMRLQRLRPSPDHPAEQDQTLEAWPGSAAACLADDIDTSRLSPRVHQVFLYAQEEAKRRRQRCVDTEHLLLGLLRAPDSVGKLILSRQGITLDTLDRKIESKTTSAPRLSKNARSRPASALARASETALTECARQAITHAAQEAHRFDRAFIETEHLLLGLILAGKGAAASLLFQEGVTVDGLRAEIMRRDKLQIRV